MEQVVELGVLGPDSAGPGLCPHRAQMRSSLRLTPRTSLEAVLPPGSRLCSVHSTPPLVSLSFGLLIYKMGQIAMPGLPCSRTAVYIKRANIM